MPNRFLIRYGRTLLAAGTMVLAGQAHAQATIDPASLANVLPAGFNGLKRDPVELKTSDNPPRSLASARYRNEARQAIRLSIMDEGAVAARTYRDEIAAYLRTDVRNDQQRSLMVGGRKALLTRYTEDRMEVETFVADRFVVRAYCVMASEGDCAEALTRVNYQAIERVRTQ